ncbi:MAG: GntR family transcriptional regulator, partial [Solirubrobacterales bacterium]
MGAREVATRVAQDVVEGRCAPRARLPAVRSLARETGCAPGTAARAYAMLRRAGIVAGRDRARQEVAADGAVRARSWMTPPDALRLAG